MNSKSVSDIVGPWQDSNFESGLIERCRRYWNVPASELPDLMIATYLGQGLATALMISEGRRRLELGLSDDTEMFEGQLREAVEQAASQLPETEP